MAQSMSAPGYAGPPYVAQVSMGLQSSNIFSGIISGRTPISCLYILMLKNGAWICISVEEDGMLQNGHYGASTYNTSIQLMQIFPITIPLCTWDHLLQNKKAIFHYHNL